MNEIERVALDIAAVAGPRMRAASRAAKTVTRKGVVDLVTETDREIETLVTERLHRLFPEHRVIGEEASASAPVARVDDDRYTWYIDPLDGTTNFAHGYPVFALSLGVARAGHLVFGLVHDPLREETFVARTGGGATCNGEAIHVSTTSVLDDALIGTGFPYDRRDDPDYYLAFWREVMLAVQGVRRAGAAALDLCYVACGRLDGFWEWKLKPWDTAAGAVIVREAGGTVSNFSGGDYDVCGDQTLASNGRIQPDLLDLLAGPLTNRHAGPAPGRVGPGDKSPSP